WTDTIIESLNQHKGDPTSRYLQIATSAIGGGVSCRTVVFRGFWEETGALKFITDHRSQKIQEIETDPRAEVCWYFRETREQFRIKGSLQVVHARETDNTLMNMRKVQWTQISPASRASFNTPHIPGLEIAENIREEEDVTKGAEGGAGESLENPSDEFCLVLLWPSSMDHLMLSGTQRRRRHVLVEETLGAG
ncbi:unnamed protein product, partial [Discosporangium mesarthrocarpum]